MKLMRKYQGHCHLVVGVSFSGCSKHVLGCSLDWNLSIWDLYKDGDRRVVKFDCPVLSAEFNPIDPNIILVLTNSGAILLTRKLPVLDFDFEGHGWSRTPLETTSNSPTTFATFAPTGRSIYLCNSKGFITIFNTSGKLLQETRLGSFQIKQIKFHNNEMIVNSDRIIRLYHISNKYSDNNDDFIMNDEIAEKNEVEFNLVMKFQDVVERSQFIQCSFSHDSEYVCAASTTGNRHDIYVWDKLTGVLVKLLQGPFEGLCDFEWHPTMPMVASISNYNGNVYIWRDIGVQKYGCFDPSKMKLTSIY